MKYTLAIESSTATPSVALLGDNELLGEISWQVSRGVSERMFSAIDELLQNNDITPADINLFGVGLGPGNFTGLRTSLSTIQAIALPSNTDIIGISSAEAATSSFQNSEDKPQSTNQQTAPSRILAVGDARRRRLWLAIFETEKESLQQIDEFELVPLDTFAERINLGDTIITPDIETLETELSVIVPNTATLIKVKQIPTAANIAHLANQRKANNTPGNPLKPIYIHPPVFIEPRFTEATKRKF
jgi:tRNA threonylcarbamoyl adenosine modification protein YeaZ